MSDQPSTILVETEEGWQTWLVCTACSGHGGRNEWVFVSLGTTTEVNARVPYGTCRAMGGRRP
ncbi:hypothetical protein GA0070618_1355 [Micromonospora echinospora]|uniref:Uncharacterized protein n=1 Tax=Micromonospora echinospora TaxID=1877 RepID=A0A1C4VLL2_MICEC|nr:hypothetical protein GA0070618_1355 [Micromonospora echinospora]